MSDSPKKPRIHHQVNGGPPSATASEAETHVGKPSPRSLNEGRAQRLAALFDLGLAEPVDSDPLDTYLRWQPKSGSRVGRYELVRQLGEGGFGIVWLAVQRDDIRRDVALKLIKPGMDSRQVTARFEAERQTLAVMDHPNIARVLDGGAAPDANPFFVMELVRGSPITEFCDQRQLSISDRLNLFVQVCNGVQHAHQKAILHRDLKPSNILVEEVDGVPVPKIIDFGIAKALGGSSVRSTQTQSALTGKWAIMGTAQYMSPEQAASETDVDACSDIYSLGTVLFELLTGSTPITSETHAEKPLAEVLRLIRDIDAPKPSSIFLSGTLGTDQNLAATNRRSDPRRLGLELRGDLDWVVLTALAKDRRRRYESAAAFAQDIRRHLQHELVLARPPTKAYVIGRLIRRNRTVFVSALLVLLAVVAACGIALWSFIKRNDAIKKSLEAEKRAVSEKDNRQQVSVYLGKMIQDITLGNDGHTFDPNALRELLQTADERRRRDLLGNPEADLRVALMLAEAHLQQGRPDKAESLFQIASNQFEVLGQGDSLDSAKCILQLVGCRHRYHEETGLSISRDDEMQLLDRCSGIFQQNLPAAQELLWQAEALRIGFIRSAGRTEEAETLVARRLSGPGSESLSESRASSWFHRERAILLGGRGKADEALDALNLSLLLMNGRKVEGRRNSELLLAADASRIRTAIFMHAGDLDGALKSAGEEEGSRRSLLGRVDPFAAIRFAEVLIRRKEIDSAVKKLNEALTVSESIGSMPAQEACLKKLLGATSTQSGKFPRDGIYARTRLAQVILAQVDQQTTSSGFRDDAKLEEADLLLREDVTAPTSPNVEAADYYATRAWIAVRREDFPAAVRNLRQADSLNSSNPAHRVGCAIFGLAAGDVGLFEFERAELLKRLSAGVSDEHLFEVCCALLLRPAVSAGQLAQIRARIESYTGDYLDSDRREFLNSFLEFREGGVLNWETTRSFLVRLRLSSDYPEVAVSSRFLLAMGLSRNGDKMASYELREGTEGFDQNIVKASSNLSANVIWFVRLLMHEADGMIGAESARGKSGN
jgi:serine/threonine protein kinase